MAAVETVISIGPTQVSFQSMPEGLCSLSNVLETRRENTTVFHLKEKGGEVGSGASCLDIERAKPALTRPSPDDTSSGNGHSQAIRLSPLAPQTPRRGGSLDDDLDSEPRLQKGRDNNEECKAQIWEREGENVGSQGKVEDSCPASETQLCAATEEEPAGEEKRKHRRRKPRITFDAMLRMKQKEIDDIIAASQKQEAEGHQAWMDRMIKAQQDARELAADMFHFQNQARPVRYFEGIPTNLNPALPRLYPADKPQVVYEPRCLQCEVKEMRCTFESPAASNTEGSKGKCSRCLRNGDTCLRRDKNSPILPQFFTARDGSLTAQEALQLASELLRGSAYRIFGTELYANEVKSFVLPAWHERGRGGGNRKVPEMLKRHHVDGN
jgi:hypothetical protein